MATPPRVRIAPSPSGYLHVGTARTAIFNWLFARHHGGQFLIRIEDTDAERSDPALVDPILDALRWLGIESDEELVFQSSRKDRYAELAQQLLASGHAYRCFATPEELEEMRNQARAEKRPPMYDRRGLRLTDDEVAANLAAAKPHVLRLRIPDGETTFDDMVAGPITRQNKDIEDLIIARSDGSATYNLAVVIDDHEMGMSHVIRGNDHISNTFKQIHLYQAFGWEVPRFGHVPLILRPDKKKVSKRLGDKDVGEYRHDGILPEAMFNYLCLLGWSPKTDREHYTVDELVTIFDDANFNASNAVFDEDKLSAFNKAHIQLADVDVLLPRVVREYVSAGIMTEASASDQTERFRTMIATVRERTRRLSDFVSLGSYFFSFDYTYDEKGSAKHLTAEAVPLLTEFGTRLAALDRFDEPSVEQVLSEVAEERGVKRAQLIHPTRLAVSGMTVGPSLFTLLVALGRETVIERVKKTVAILSGG